jgi:hypothetical protein
MFRFASRFAAVVLALCCISSALAQEAKEPGKAVVSIYRVAPGKHVDFLKWMAAREALNKEAGVAATQWYVHQDGDSWDYIAIAPNTSSEQDKKLDEMAKAKGLTVGFRAGLELRQYMASHTDTYARGPITAAELVDLASK